MARIRSRANPNTGSAITEPTGDDDISQVLKGIVERARPILQQRQAARVRDKLTESQPLVSPDTPLSPRSMAHLASYGISGLSTYGEAKTHLEQTASSFGLPVGGTKKITESGPTTNTAAHVRAKLDPGQSPAMPAHEAELLDMVDTLHRGIRGFMTHPTSPSDPVPNRVERLQVAAAIEDANPEPQETPKPATSRTPRGTPASTVKKATKRKNASDNPLVVLPPAKNKRELVRRQKMMDAERQALALSKQTAYRDALERVKAGQETFTAEHGPGGWATYSGISPASTESPATPKTPLNLRDVVASAKDFLAKEDELDAKKLASRAKYPENDNPVI